MNSLPLFHLKKLTAALFLCALTPLAQAWEITEITPAPESEEQVFPKLTLPLPIAVADENRIELRSDNALVRLSANTACVLEGESQFHLELGAALIYLDDSTLSCSLPRASLKLEGHGTVILEHTTNGAGKLIALEGDIKATLPKNTTRMLRAGNAVFLLPDKNAFGPDVDIDLSILASTSMLVIGFTNELPSFNALRQEIFYQQHRLKGRANAVLGDAPDSEQFNVMVLEKQE